MSGTPLEVVMFLLQGIEPGEENSEIQFAAEQTWSSTA